MLESARLQLRRLLLIAAAAGLVGLVGYCIALAVAIYGLVLTFTSMISNSSTLSGILISLIGNGVQLVICVLITGIRERFERQCWALIVANDGAMAVNENGSQVLTKQTDGDGNLLAAVRARQSRRFSQRLRALIAQAWPNSGP